ncbi:hypothetical protein GVAV_002326 [Gurleya vavrai]
MSKDCQGCKLFFLAFPNEISYNKLCKECQLQEDRMKHQQPFFSKMYRRYASEFAISDLEWFESIFVNLFAMIVFYSFFYQCGLMMIEILRYVKNVFAFINCLVKNGCYQ